MYNYKILEHIADLKIKAFGQNLEELFSNAALGMMEFIYKDIRYPISDIGEKISLKSKDIESLLVDWLSELLYLSEINKSAYTKFNIKEISETKLEAEVFGQQAEKKNDIKAATYHQLKIEKTNQGYIAVVLFDI